MMSGFENKSVLITGACGTIGSELTRQAVEMGANRVVCLDNNESDLFFLEQTFAGNDEVECYISDIRDIDALNQRMRGIDMVLHAAALKHVGLCENSPTQAVRTNIDGTQNVIEAALKNNVSRVIFTSSDKAVNPTNVMGTTKLMGERLMTAASYNNKNCGTIFASTRFGNVLGSRGSVVPLFRHQIEKGGPVTLTDRRMTRFVMTLHEAVGLVLKSALAATGGEVFVTKMPVARIEDIARHMVEKLAALEKIEIVEIGAKPGEKMYEELMNDEEVRRTFETDEFFVILPAHVKDHESSYPLVRGRQKADRPYNSDVEAALTPQELAQCFASWNVF